MPRLEIVEVVLVHCNLVNKNYQQALIIIHIYNNTHNNNAYDKKLTFKNNAPFISCVRKVSNTLIDDTFNLDVVTPLYNLLEYSKNNRKLMELLQR